MLILHSLVFGFLICLVAFYGNFLWRRRRLYYLASKIPGPKGLPFIGMVHKFLNVEFDAYLYKFSSMAHGYSSICKFWLGPELVIFAADPHSLQIILNSQKCLDKSPLYDVLVLTKGLLVGSGQIWRTHRKILNPAFNISLLQQLIPLFDEKSKIFIKNLEREVDKKPFDVYGYMSACSLETLLKGTMEIDRDIQSDPFNNKYVYDIECCAKVLMKKMFNPFYHLPPLYRLTNLYHLEERHLRNGVLKFADEVLEEKRKAMKAKEEDSTFCEDDGYKKKQRNFIKTLLNPQNNLSEQELKDEINTLVAAGHETSAAVISEALLMLAMRPEAQQKVVEELKEIYGTADEMIDFESLNKLTYLDMVVKETMRLFPVVPISARKSTGEFQIGDYTVPSGATVMIDSFSVQRNKKYWGDDADQFRPERFEPQNFEKVHPYAYIPFTGGPRLCIGWRYGMLFVKSVLANFLRKYEVNTNLKYDNLSFEMTLTLKILQRCMLTLRRREF